MVTYIPESIVRSGEGPRAQEVNAVTDFEYEDERLLSVTEMQAGECPSRRVEPMWKLDPTAASLELADGMVGTDGTTRPWALLLDGGDLGDVHRILDLARTPLVRLTDTVPTKECWPSCRAGDARCASTTRPPWARG